MKRSLNRRALIERKTVRSTFVFPLSIAVVLPMVFGLVRCPRHAPGGAATRGALTPTLCAARMHAPCSLAHTPRRRSSRTRSRR